MGPDEESETEQAKIIENDAGPKTKRHRYTRKQKPRHGDNAQQPPQQTQINGNKDIPVGAIMLQYKI